MVQLAKRIDWPRRQSILPISSPFLKSFGESKTHDLLRCFLRMHGQSIIGNMVMRILRHIPEIWDVELRSFFKVWNGEKVVFFGFSIWLRWWSNSLPQGESELVVIVFKSLFQTCPYGVDIGWRSFIQTLMYACTRGSRKRRRAITYSWSTY